MKLKSKRNKIYAIVPTFNSVRTVKKAVESLLFQTIKLDKIIVVDNASVDGTAQILHQHFGRKIQIIHNRSNTGVTGGRNAGLQYCQDADLILFFDHDMIADRNMVKHLIDGINTQPKIGITTPKIYYLSAKKNIWSAGTGINLWTGQVLFRGGLDTGHYEEDEEVQVAPATLLVKKEVLKKVKRFDDIYFATYEDTDFCFSARKYGFLTYYISHAVAYHDLPFDTKTAQNRLIERLYFVGRNRLIFLRRFGYFTSVPVSFLFSIYYFWLCLKNGKIIKFLDFIKGTIDGMLVTV